MNDITTVLSAVLESDDRHDWQTTENQYQSPRGGWKVAPYEVTIIQAENYKKYTIDNVPVDVIESVTMDDGNRQWEEVVAWVGAQITKAQKVTIRDGDGTINTGAYRQLEEAIIQQGIST